MSTQILKAYGDRIAALTAERDRLTAELAEQVHAIQRATTDWQHAIITLRAERDAARADYAKVVAERFAEIQPVVQQRDAALALADARAAENAELRAALENLQNVVADAGSIGEMYGEDALLEPWAMLADHSEKYLGLLSRPADARGADILAAAEAMAEALGSFGDWHHSDKMVVRDSTRSRHGDVIQHQVLGSDLVRTVVERWRALAPGAPGGAGERP